MPNQAITAEKESEERQNNATFTLVGSTQRFCTSSTSVSPSWVCSATTLPLLRRVSVSRWNKRMSNSVTEDVELEAAIKDSPQEDHTQQMNHIEKKEDHPIPMPSPHLQVEILRKKYGGLLPKKPPLISKDHEHAFFDSADWALGKQGGQKAKGPLEALRPKLEPTPHHQARSWRSTFRPADDDDQDIADGDTVGAASEDHACTGDDDAKNAASTEGECTGCDPSVNP